jgi:iron(III) transport system substrate-binding protein
VSQRSRAPHRALGAALGALLLAALPAAALAADPSPSPASPEAAAAATPSPGPAAGSLTVYSGRSEQLVAPLIEDFTAATGIPVAVRYGDSAELANLLLQEGDRSPADVFFAQDAGSLGAVSEAGLFSTLAADALERVPERFRSAGGTWAGVSGRARVAAVSTERVAEADVPDSILAFTDPAWRDRLGWVPTNASFQAFVTALRLEQGDDVARDWLEGILANAPVEYESNTAAVEAVAAGEVDVSFVNHYYLMRLLAEQGETYPFANHFFASGDIGSLVNVAGAGVLATSDQREQAARFVEYLLSDAAQAYFAESTFEYPLVSGIPVDPRLPALESITGPDIDLGRLADLQGTVELLRDVGALD